MKALLFVLIVTLVALSASALPRPAEANSPDWPALLNCSDVNADGNVSIADIGHIVSKFGTHVVKDTDGKFVPGPDYMLLYDLNGGGNVGVSDIAKAVQDFGATCPLLETQVAAATLAMAGLPPFDSNPDLRNWSEAEPAGWQQTTQYVPAMGIHVQKLEFLTKDFNHLTPVGTVYKSAGGAPDDLIGAWFVVPIPEVCTEFTVDPNSGVFGVDPATCDANEPAGFDGPEDNAPGGWHDHTGLCTGSVGTTNAQVTETFSQSSEMQANCLGGVFFPCGASGCYWFDTYGFMIHLYNFIPNPAGRFQMWNSNT